MRTQVEDRRDRQLFDLISLVLDLPIQLGRDCVLEFFPPTDTAQRQFLGQLFFCWTHHEFALLDAFGEEEGMRTDGFTLFHDFGKPFFQLPGPPPEDTFPL